MNKLSELMGSRRFWIVTVAGIIWIMNVLTWIPNEISLPIIAWLLTIAGIGTADKLFK